MESRLATFAAIVAGVLLTSGAPVPPMYPPVAVDVDGLEALPHRVSIVMWAGGQNWNDDRGGGFWDPERVAPSFVLYEDGLVIYRVMHPNGSRMMEGHLSRAESAALVDELDGYGFARLPHKQWLTRANHQPGASILLRRGTTWHAAEVDGIDRWGHVSDPESQEEEPSPAFVTALRRLALFDMTGAVPWKQRDFAVQLNDGRLYPPSGRVRGSWPASVPPPSIEVGSTYANGVYDMKYAAAIREIQPQDCGELVLFGGRTWGVHITPALVPEHAYIERVANDVSLAAYRVQESLCGTAR